MRRDLMKLAVLTLIAIGGLIFLRMTSPARAACEPEPITANTPTGIAGCEVWGEGVASHYGPGYGAAMNFCTWERRHSVGCGSATVTSLDTGVTVVVPIVDFCDCYTGTPNQRVIDLQHGVVEALGLELAAGLYDVVVWPAEMRPGSERGPHPATTSSALPDTAMPR